jgi:hypothetical protein
MKLKAFILTLFSLIIFLKANALSTTPDSWSIGPNYLRQGSVYINYSGTTNIQAQVKMTRVSTQEEQVYIVAATTNNDGTWRLLMNPQMIDASTFEAYAPGSLFCTVNIQFNTDPTLKNRRIYLLYSSDPLFPSYATFSVNTSYATAVQPDPSTYDAIPSQYANAFLNYSYQFDNPNTEKIITMSDNVPVLTVGQSIYSASGLVRLTLQTDGNLVIYIKNSSGVESAVWSSRTQGKQVSTLFFQTDGNLVIYAGTSENSTAVWASGIYNLTGKNTVRYAYYTLQDDGNFVLNWPASYFTNGTFNAVDVIMAASDSQQSVGVSSHPGNLNHVLWGNNYQQAVGAAYNSSTP